jgi:hypothetical protein
MDRDELLKQMRDAETLDEMSEAIYEARMWLHDHPDDEQIVAALHLLIGSERESLGVH